jgi:hypothetical protein
MGIKVCSNKENVLLHGEVIANEWNTRKTFLTFLLQNQLANSNCVDFKLPFGERNSKIIQINGGVIRKSYSQDPLGQKSSNLNGSFLR